MGISLFIIIAALVFAGILIAGICFLIYFLYEKHEKNKQEKEITDYEE